MADDNEVLAEDSENEAGAKPEGSITELQIINTILTKRDFSIIVSNCLSADYFPGYEQEFKFIQDHLEQYKVIPEETTFLGKFPDFPLFDVNESEQAMIFSIKEARGYELLAPALREIDDLAKNNSIEAAKAMRAKAEEIINEVSVVRFQKGLDLIAGANERYQEYLRRLSLKGQLGNMFGIVPFDRATGGIWENDFVGILGRPGQGKSWIAEFLAMQPWQNQGRNVLFFSLENPKEVVGFRFDSLLDHFSNFSLMTGSDVVEWDNGHPKRDQNDYKEYIESLVGLPNKFEVLDSSDSISGFTVEDILEISKQKNPDIIVIDQLSLIAPSGSYHTIRESYTHITRTIRKAVNDMRKPIYLCCQAGRASVKDGRNKEASTPELEHIAESDSVGQDATKIVSIIQSEGILKMSLKKNTLGKSGVDAVFSWDIDRGMLKATTENEMESATDAF